jgi:hypothetical protein
MSTEVAAGPTPSNHGTAIWAAALVAGVALVLTAQFILDGWADSNQTAHWTQHALLFLAGLTTGASILRLYQLGSRAT